MIKKPIRVALSGSGFKFPAHVGALIALRDLNYVVIEYAGTSGGSIVAALAACGMHLDDMKVLTLNHNWKPMLTWSPLQIFKGARAAYCSGNTLLDWILEETFHATFAHLQIPLTIMSSDAVTQTPFEFSNKATPTAEIGFAARCSACIPGVYAAMKYQGVLLQDGGLVNNIPVDKLIRDKVPRLGIQLVSKVTPLAPNKSSLVGLLASDLNMMLSANENTHVEMDEEEGANFSFVETGYANGLDRNMSVELRSQLFKDGYNATMKAMQPHAKA
jgi:NTE family protein